MRAVAAWMAIAFGGLTGLLFCLALELERFSAKKLILAAFAVGLTTSAIIALRRGIYWPLRLAWITFVTAFVASDPPGGLFEGGIVTIPILLALIVGTACSFAPKSFD